ncbi:MAG: hypothetical protein C4K60_11735 [Ideonella sp. MAG2]|nr:MAG: hypothetical protein C4K60_11735 [Ideonella sp. MAG2]
MVETARVSIAALASYHRPMNASTHIIFACFAMVALVAVVAVRMFVVRVAEFKQRRIHPQEAATSILAGQKLQAVQASDNFKNLFEVPVLFYLLCSVLLATNNSSNGYVAGAWVFVLFRGAHSYIQCTYNNVMHRFACFAISSLVLLAMWVGMVIELAAKRAA